MTKIGKCRLRGLLAKRGISQVQLAERTGLSNKQISDYVTNRRVMSLKNAFLIAGVLGCSIEDLYEYPNWHRANE